MSSVDSGVSTPVTQRTDAFITRALPRALRVYVGLLVGLWALAVLPLAVRSKHLAFFQGLWFVPPFYDFGAFYERMQLLHRPEFWTSPVGPVWDYPAPSVLVYQLFYAFNRGSGGEHRVFFGFLAYLIFCGAVLLLAGVLLARAVHRRGVRWKAAMPFVATALLLCWPVYFCMQRGNIEFFLDAGVAAGVWAYVRRRWWLAAVLIGVFGAGKLYPLLLLSLLLPLRRWKELLLGIATAAGVTMFATRWIGRAPAASGHGVSVGLKSWVVSNSLIFGPIRNGYDHSIFAFLKLINRGDPHAFLRWALGYAVVGSVGMLALFFLRTWKMPRLNQLLLVSAAAVLLPPSSFDYTLILLLPVWVWMTLQAMRQVGTVRERQASMVAMGVFAMLFAPESFAVWRGTFLAGQLKMAGLLMLLAIAAWVPMPEEAAT